MFSPTGIGASSMAYISSTIRSSDTTAPFESVCRTSAWLPSSTARSIDRMISSTTISSNRPLTWRMSTGAATISRSTSDVGSSSSVYGTVVHLPFDERRVDGTADVVDGDDLLDLAVQDHAADALEGVLEDALVVLERQEVVVQRVILDSSHDRTPVGFPYVPGRMGPPREAVRKRCRWEIHRSPWIVPPQGTCRNRIRS